MMRLSGLWREFKSFAFKGNMIDLAVAVVIGAAFSGVINALVSDIIMPSISYVVTAAQTAGGAASDAAQHAVSVVVHHPATTTSSTHAATTTSSTMPAAATHPAGAPAAVATTAPATQQVIVVTVPAAPTPPAPPAAGSIDFAWKVGRIQIGHFIGSLINFLLVAFAIFVIVVKMLGNVVKRITPVSPTEPTTKECPRCLSNIPHRATKCPFCTADLDPPAATVPDAVA